MLEVIEPSLSESTGPPITEMDHHYLTFRPSLGHKVCRVQEWI